MTKRVVFAGGTQAKALAKAYRLDIAVDRDEDVFFIGAEAMVREAAHRVIAAADIVVTDVTEAGETVPERLVPANAERIGVPVILAGFLWPFAGRPHPRNRGIDALPSGPYPADFGDGFLDKMLADQVPAEEAVQRYLALDVAAHADLDGLLEDALALQGRLDRRTGFDLADFIASRFRQENLFATRERLRLPLFRHVAATVLERMGAGRARADTLTEAPFQAGAMPIHPGVLRHFGMQHPSPNHRYPVLDEGLFTFEQFCRRYLAYDWNELLHVAIALAETSPAEAIPALRRALEISPGSRAGHDALDEAERSVAESRAQAPLALGAPEETAPRPASTPAPSASQSMYAPADAPLLSTDLAAAMPPLPPLLQVQPPPATPVFADSSFAALQFSSTQVPPAEDDDEQTDPETIQASPISAFVAAPRASAPPMTSAEESGPQSYVELPLTTFGQLAEPAAAVIEAPDRYTPLPPSAELIEVLPRMLPSSARLAGTVEASFAAMPETMPPPPLRPILPPELHAEPEKRGLVSRLFGLH